MKFYNKQKNKASISSSQDGFTLIELMIATTLFTIIMVMGVGSLVVSSNSAKKSQKLRTAVDNVNFAMESMTRELRMGTYYSCDTADSPDINSLSDCNGNVIAFKPQQVGVPPSRVFYGLQQRVTDGTYTLRRCENSISNCADIVSSDVVIETLKFFVKGANLTDKIQPNVRILLTGSVTIKGEKTNFSLQTLAAQRSAEK